MWSSCRDSQAAWRNALRKGMRNARHTRAMYPHEALLEVLYRWFGFCPSTSGLEQGFSSISWGFSSRQMAGSDLHEESTIKLLVDGRNDDLENTLCPEAQRVWQQLFGVSRIGGSENRQQRIDAGTTKLSTPDNTEQCEAAFVRRLRLARVHNHMPLEDVLDAVDSLPAPAAWSENHQKEMNFIKSK